MNLEVRSRDYDPSTGQFLSRDPAAATTRSPYGYVNDNPLNGTDPTGLCGWTDPFGCASDALGAVASTAEGVGNWVANNKLETLGLVAGTAALATGVGALAGVEVLGISAEALGTISVGAGLVAGGADLPSCLGGAVASCSPDGRLGSRRWCLPDGWSAMLMNAKAFTSFWSPRIGRDAARLRWDNARLVCVAWLLNLVWIPSVIAGVRAALPGVTGIGVAAGMTAAVCIVLAGSSFEPPTEQRVAASGFGWGFAPSARHHALERPMKPGVGSMG